MKIDVQDLHFAYGSRPILKIGQTIFESGKIYGIVGRNGVGKTTFFKALTNIITNYTGSVSYNGQVVKENPAVLTKVGIMLDDMELYKGHTGLFNLRYFGGLRGGFDEAKALDLARQLEIQGALGQKVSSYSLGMNKKLILLISLMNDAEVLIFDEPFRGIDAASVNWFREKLLTLKSEGRLVIISSHVQEDIESVCDEVFLLHDGDFTDTFDLTDLSQKLIYTVEVNNVANFSKILTDRGLSMLTKDKLVKFEANPSEFQSYFQEAVAVGVIFEEIKKESKFSDFVAGTASVQQKGAAQ